MLSGVGMLTVTVERAEGLSKEWMDTAISALERSLWWCADDNYNEKGNDNDKADDNYNDKGDDNGKDDGNGNYKGNGNENYNKYFRCGRDPYAVVEVWNYTF